MEIRIKEEENDEEFIELYFERQSKDYLWLKSRHGEIVKTEAIIENGGIRLPEYPGNLKQLK